MTSTAAITKPPVGKGHMREKVSLLKSNVEKVFVGSPEVVRALLVGVLGAGHVLIEDVPGVGKTVLARSLATSINAKFSRIQFTPDLLPTDILGVSVLDQSCGQFVFKHGPIFAHVVLADEINRATPRTQSALLEAMNELAVSADGTTYQLPSPFMLIATQNPFEFEGTFPLPEGQLDRFMVRLRVGYPSGAQEREILKHGRLYHEAGEIEPVLTPEDVLSMQGEVKAVRVDDSIGGYVVAIAETSRAHEEVGARDEPARIAHAAESLAGSRVYRGEGLRHSPTTSRRWRRPSWPTGCSCAATRPARAPTSPDGWWSRSSRRSKRPHRDAVR